MNIFIVITTVLFMAYVVNSILFLRKELNDLELLNQQRIRHLRKQIAILKLKNEKEEELKKSVGV